MIVIDWATLPSVELQALCDAAYAEQQKREQLASIPTQMDGLIDSWRQASGVVDGSAWKQPTGAHDAYPKDAKVTHGGKVWASTTRANVWTPGVSGWREVVTVPKTPTWIQPTGAHDAYAKNALVTHGGFTWKSDADANTWAPGVYGWTKQAAV